MRAPGIDPRPIRYSLFGPLTPVAKALIGVNVLIFLLLRLAAPAMQAAMITLLGLVPAEVSGGLALWQLASYLFLHAGWWHLIMNMLCLWWFGSAVEMLWGGKHFLRFYFFTGVGAGLTHLALRWGSSDPVIGASGSIFGLLLAYGMLFPEREVLLIVFPMKAKYFVALLAAMEFFFALSDGRGADPVARLAHLGGLLFALLWFLYYRGGFRYLDFGRWRLAWQRRRLRRRLRIVEGTKADAETAAEEEEKERPPTIH